MSVETVNCKIRFNGQITKPNGTILNVYYVECDNGWSKHVHTKASMQTVIQRIQTGEITLNKPVKQETEEEFTVELGKGG